MPKRYSKKPSFKKKRYNKKRKMVRKYKRHGPSTMIMKFPTVVADRLKTKLKYTDVFSVQVNGGAQSY